ncbi:DoxX family protein [Nocardiopsis aegyptia]|uniref:Putative oxidoreductase n=1 Tax=Nocardiopsis aegyptia TaxID=220378 RepID=A0A7Z0JC41_9ACTN|nr:DoxX family protein [Nocardiopsis aegyptia]NYJ36120.1 putative oxidoreductase [Nocardiopsis aegyptia]
MNKELARDIGILIGRLGVGFVLLAYGWQKLADWGVSGTAEIMAGGGVPMPMVSAYIATFVELAAGTAFIVGAAMPLAGLAAAGTMAGAFLFVHMGSGVYVDQNGWGFVLVIGVSCLMLAATGSGRFGIDPLVASRFRDRRKAPAHST